MSTHDEHASAPTEPTGGAGAVPPSSIHQPPPGAHFMNVLRWALFESVAIFGLVLGILHHSFVHFVPFGMVALALMAMTPPRIKQEIDAAIALLPSS